jgi:hypothetical protein
MTSIDNSTLLCTAKSTSKEEAVEEVVEETVEEAVEEVVEEEEEEALWEHLSQLVNHKHKLLFWQQQMSNQLVNYHRYLMEQGIKQMLSSKKLKPTSKSIKML